MLQYLQLKDFRLECGARVPDLRLAYTTYGKLNDAADNAILFPTYFTGCHEDNERLIGAGRALDTDQYFIVVPNMFGNGRSSSPSNTSTPFDGRHFPLVSLFDNVRAQARLLDQLGVLIPRLILGWSMGGMQCYHWCVEYPYRVSKALIMCATAKTSIHNHVFLEGVKAALQADAEFNSGDYQHPPVRGLRAFARVYAGWGYSQAFFRHEMYRTMGFDDIEDLLLDWEADHLKHDANDLLAALKSWQSADISGHPRFGGNLACALSSIQATVWLMPCEQDMYFRHEDNQAELAHLKYGSYRGFESEFGHCAANPGRFADETALIERTIADLLADL